MPPTTENLYVTDSLNYTLINYSVSSSGALNVVPTASAAPSVPTGRTPSGVTVDPCNRFAYVSNQLDNSVSAYTICNVVSLPTCAKGDFSLLPVTGSPFTTGIAPGPVTIQCAACKDARVIVLDPTHFGEAVAKDDPVEATLGSKPLREFADFRVTAVDGKLRFISSVVFDGEPVTITFSKPHGYSADNLPVAHVLTPEFALRLPHLP